jgi:hypothetical protein
MSQDPNPQPVVENVSQKPYSDLDASQTVQASFNDNTFAHLVDGFLSGLVGRRIDITVTETNVPGDTQNFAFSEQFGAYPLLTIQIVYTDASQATMLYAQRTA